MWVDYDAAVSIHRVRVAEPKERRLQRLASRSIADNRVSFGCINVPVAFYDTVIQPTVAARLTIVYVLPETRPVQQVFGSYEVGQHVAVAPIPSPAHRAPSARSRRAGAARSGI